MHLRTKKWGIRLPEPGHVDCAVKSFVQLRRTGGACESQKHITAVRMAGLASMRGVPARLRHDWAGTAVAGM